MYGNPDHSWHKQHNINSLNVIYCDTGEIDNEIHFLFKCPFHSAGRFSLLQEIVHYLPLQSEPDHRDMFINIMNSKKQMILNAFG